MQKVELHRLYITWEVHIFLNLIYSQTDSHKELSTIIEKAKHKWLLRLLHYGLNIGITFDDLKSRDEKSINTLLENFQKPSKLSNNVNVPKQEYDYPQNAGKKAEIMILPLSIDDETTTSGTASIFTQRQSVMAVGRSCICSASILFLLLFCCLSRSLCHLSTFLFGFCRVLSDGEVAMNIDEMD